MLEVTNNGNGKEKHYIMENSVYAPSQALERIMQAGEKRPVYSGKNFQPLQRRVPGSVDKWQTSV